MDNTTLQRLLAAVKAITPHGTVCLQGIPHPVTGNGNSWQGTISVGDVILAEHTGEVSDVLETLISKLGTILERVKQGLAPTEPPPGHEDF